MISLVIRKEDADRLMASIDANMSLVDDLISSWYSSITRPEFIKFFERCLIYDGTEESKRTLNICQYIDIWTILEITETMELLNRFLSLNRIEDLEGWLYEQVHDGILTFIYSDRKDMAAFLEVCIMRGIRDMLRTFYMNRIFVDAERYKDSLLVDYNDYEHVDNLEQILLDHNMYIDLSKVNQLHRQVLVNIATGARSVRGSLTQMGIAPSVRINYQKEYICVINKLKGS